MAMYKEALERLNTNQRKAVETIDGPVLVIAGPGTGKTQLLTTRIAHILAVTDTLPQNILCLTFTDSAAQTMQERLSSMIGQSAYDVTISTYHAFGSDIIRRFPDYFTEQAELQPADDLTIDRVFRQIVHNLPYSNPLKYSDAYLGDVKTLVSDAKRALLTPDDLKKIAAQNLLFIQRVNPIIRKTLAGLSRIDKKAIPLFAELASQLDSRLRGNDKKGGIETNPSGGAGDRSATSQGASAASADSGESAVAEPEKLSRRPADSNRLMESFSARERSPEAADVDSEALGNEKQGGDAGTSDSLPSDSEALRKISQPDSGPSVSLSNLFLDSLQEAVAAAEESGKTTTLTAWKNAWLAKDENGQFIADGLRANQKIIAAAQVYEQYLQQLQTRGLFDYDDMILRAVHALETNDDLKFTLQEQYQYILLDEFQDTNEAQLRIVQLLTDNPVNEGRPNVLAVGDDDQAIYAFQGANYSHMLQFNHMYKGVTAIPLTENYRSHPDILHTARGIAEQIEERLHHHFPAIEKTLTAAAQNLPTQATIERREAQSDVMQYAWVTRRIAALIEQGTEPEEIAVLAPKHRHLEPLVPFLTQENIAVRYDKRENVLDDPALNQLLRMAELTLALGQNDTPRANSLWPQVLSFGFWELPTSTIWRLSWQTGRDRADWTNELLQDEQLKPVALFFVRLSQIAGTETLETMLDYLIGTEALNLNEPGLTTFKSPYYEHYFGELELDSRLHGNDEKEDADDEKRSEDGNEQGASAASAASGESAVAEPDFGQRDLRLDDQNHARERSPEAADADSEALSNASRPDSQTSNDSLLSGGEPRKSKLNADFWNLLTNLIVLRARLREYHGDGEERLTLGHFVEFVRAHRDADIKILNTNPYASGTSAVHLMTAYKAKGMEFKAVFILDTNDESWGGKARNIGARITLPPNLQYIRYAGTTEDERLRLLYVAVTRAKQQLYLMNYTKNYAGKNMTRLKYLNETATEEGEIISPLLPEGDQIVLAAEDGVPEPTTELAAYWQQRHEAALKNADMQALLHDRLKTFQLSATHISDFVDFVHCGPQSFFMLRILRFPQAPRAELQYGNAIHETLEWIHIQAKQTGVVPAETAAHQALSQRLAAKRLAEHDYTLYLERGKETLSAYLQQRAHTIAPDNIVEHNFRNEGVFIGPARLGGTIDKLIIDKQAKEITIVDYKTGRTHTKWSREYNLHKNRQQLYFYRALVEGSHTFAGYKVTGAYLEFVEPDENGKIQELHLNFDENEYQHIRKLAESVWRHITTLDLPDTSTYTHDLKGIEEFEVDLIRSQE